MITREKDQVYRSTNRICPAPGGWWCKGCDEVCRKMGISEATYYNWKKKFGCLGVTVVVPLSKVGTRPFVLTNAIINILILIVCIGLPLSFMASQTLYKRSKPVTTRA